MNKTAGFNSNTFTNELCRCVPATHYWFSLSAHPVEVCLLKQESWRQTKGLMVHFAVAVECYLQNDSANPSFGGDAFGKSHGLQNNIAKSRLTAFFSYGLL